MVIPRGRGESSRGPGESSDVPGEPDASGSTVPAAPQARAGTRAPAAGSALSAVAPAAPAARFPLLRDARRAGRRGVRRGVRGAAGRRSSPSAMRVVVSHRLVDGADVTLARDRAAGERHERRESQGTRPSRFERGGSVRLLLAVGVRPLHQSDERARRIGDEGDPAAVAVGRAVRNDHASPERARPAPPRPRRPRPARSGPSGASGGRRRRAAD